jgi:hypothetical protein
LAASFSADFASSGMTQLQAKICKDSGDSFSAENYRSL